MRFTLLTGCLAAGLILPGLATAQSGWKKLDGQSVPAIHADNWLNTPKGAPVPKSLQGKVWLLEFFATT